MTCCIAPAPTNPGGCTARTTVTTGRTRSRTTWKHGATTRVFHTAEWTCHTTSRRSGTSVPGRRLRFPALSSVPAYLFRGLLVTQGHPANVQCQRQPGPQRHAGPEEDHEQYTVGDGVGPFRRGEEQRLDEQREVEVSHR